MDHAITDTDACRDYPPRCIGAEQEQLALGTPISRSSAAELYPIRGGIR